MLSKKDMKTRNIFIIAVLLYCSLIYSCHTVYFSNPLPVDSRNIYKIPREYRGEWFSESDSVIIGKKYFRFISKEDIRIAKSEVDTGTRFLLRDNLIYRIYKEVGLSHGFTYTLKVDTISFTERTLTEIPLSTNTFLRKVHGGYILNLIGRVIDGKTDDWYLTGYLKKASREEIIFAVMDHNAVAAIPTADLVYQTEYDHYYNAAWTRKEMDSIIKQGFFSDTIYKLRKEKYSLTQSDSFNFELTIPLDSVGGTKPGDNEKDW